MEKVHFISLGCPKNLVDSEIMLGHLTREGYELTANPDEAQTVVVNTCGFIEDAKRESIGKILEASKLKEDGKLKRLVVAGCLTQRYKQELVDELPEADIFIGSGEFQNIAQILKKHEAGDKTKTYFHLPTFLQQEETPRINSQPGYTAYLKISEGCMKRCAFCAIPLIRGNLQSRKISAIVSEAELLLAGGVREINVISHDFSDYGWDIRKTDPQAVESPENLLEALSNVKGLDWIRVLYLYPDGVTPRLIEIMKQHPNVLPYFDMPLQHISDRMLKSMNRKMTKAEIVERISMIRANMPDAVIRTQFIVGYPGETEQDFAELLDFVEEMEFDRVGCFKYSAEEKTPASRLPDPVSDEVQQERYDALMGLQQGISRKKLQRFVGQVVPVLVEGPSEESELLLQGRMPLQAPEIDGVVLINSGTADVGSFCSVRITDAHDYDLVGEIVGPNPSLHLGS